MITRELNETLASLCLQPNGVGIGQRAPGTRKTEALPVFIKPLIDWRSLDQTPLKAAMSLPHAFTRDIDN